jgi:hypothetical protein
VFWSENPIHREAPAHTREEDAAACTHLDFPDVLALNLLLDHLDAGWTVVAQLGLAESSGSKHFAFDNVLEVDIGQVGVADDGWGGGGGGHSGKGREGKGREGKEGKGRGR